MLCKPYHKLGVESELLERGSNSSSSSSLQYNLTAVSPHLPAFVRFLKGETWQECFKQVTEKVPQF